MVKGLSIRQPYATMIAAGLKARETRDWSSLYRGDVLIHAAKAWGREEQRDLESLMQFDAVRELFAPMLTNGGKPPLGVALGVARMVSCDRAEDIRSSLPEIERAAGGYANGRFAFLMQDIRLFETPVPMRGQLGIFDVPMPNARLVPATAAPTISSPKPAPAPRPSVDSAAPISTYWADVHARNPYTRLLIGRRPAANVIDTGWARLVQRVYGWTSAALEVEIARQSLVDAKVEWLADGGEIKHHLEMYRAREKRETAAGSEISDVLAAQIARYAAELIEHKKKNWSSRPYVRVASAQDRLSAVEQELNELAVICWLSSVEREYP